MLALGLGITGEQANQSHARYGVEAASTSTPKRNSPALSRTAPDSLQKLVKLHWPAPRKFTSEK